MCCAKAKCEKPKNLKARAEDCSPEQIKKCHGESKKHPCVTPVSRRPRKS